MIAAIGSTPAALAAKAATSTIPIVFTTAADPAAVGLVASLNRPGGNVTGVTTLSAELASKRLELLHEVVPTATVVALLVNPTKPNLAESLSQSCKRRPVLSGYSSMSCTPALSGNSIWLSQALAQLRAGGLVITADAFFTSQSEQLAALAVRHAVPTIYQ